MAIYYFDFQGGNGAGTSPADSRNTWVTPGNGDVFRFRRGSRWDRVGQVNLAFNTSLTFEAYWNPDGTDDETQPKPIITVRLSAGTSAFNFQGTGVHIIRNLVFRDFVDTTDPLGNNPNALTFGTTGTYGVDPGVSAEVWNCEFYNIPNNACNFNGNNSASTPNLAADRMRVMHCIFDGIGNDCVFGQAKDCEIAYNRMSRMSNRAQNGDGVGLLYFDPTNCYIHHNFIDHQDTDFKHCIIVDGANLGVGITRIEDNFLLGKGTVGINVSECRAIIRRNTIYTEDIGIFTNADGPVITGNTIFVRGDRNTGTATLEMFTSNAICKNNTIIWEVKPRSSWGTSTGSGRTGNVLRNNLYVNGAVGHRQGTGTTDSFDYNAFDNVTAPYLDGSLNPISISANDLIVQDSCLRDGTIKSISPVLHQGVHAGYGLDNTGNMFNNPPSIGAHEYIEQRGVRF